jgi:hypothetical protein
MFGPVQESDLTVQQVAKGVRILPHCWNVIAQ